MLIAYRNQTEYPFVHIRERAFCNGTIATLFESICSYHWEEVESAGIWLSLKIKRLGGGVFEEKVLIIPHADQKVVEDLLSKLSN